MTNRNNEQANFYHRTTLPHRDLDGLRPTVQEFRQSAFNQVER